MSELNFIQARDIVKRMTQLAVLAEQQDKASDAAFKANQRWNAAREDYAREWADLARTYGEENAPQWIESLRGPKPKIEATT